MATISDEAARLGLSVEDLFEQAFRRFGLSLSAGGTSAADLAWWKKWGTEPLYVRKYIKHLDQSRRLPVVSG